VSLSCRLSRHIGAALVVGLIASGCASVRLADPAQDITSKEFVVPPGKALIYVVRDGGFIYGAYQLFRIILDRRDYGPLAEGTYFVFPVDPGPHAVMAAWKQNMESVQIPANAGSIYFVSVQSGISWVNTTVSVSALSDEKGKAAILAAKMAVSE
jgi:hypothetical protein